MRIDYCSDLHLDNAMSGGPHGWLGSVNVFGWKAGGETLVVAGDTADHVDDTIDFLNSVRKHYPNVVTVLGNHEACNPRKALKEGVHVLDWCASNSVVIGDVAFVGGCLPPDAELMLKDIRRSLRTACNAVGVRAVVGVSHYPPSSRLAAAFGCDLIQASSSLLDGAGLGSCQPTAWISGHLHLPSDMTIGETRHVSNPRGYRARRRDGSVWSGFRTLEV